jgi:transcriptional regulator with XRE-family HTH domain
VAKIKVKEIREAKGISQESIAKELGITQASYSYKENGKRGFSVKELLILEVILEASISELFADIKKGI